MGISALSLTHYSAAPVTELRSTPIKGRRDDKPCGLWISVDGDGDGWADWCRSEDFRTDNLACVHDVVLRDDARILLLNSGCAIDAFGAEYGLAPSERWHSRGYGIDWTRVGAEYQGILIAPYQWSRRLHDGCFWYYGWDCASGCIWDAAAIESITMRAPADAARQAA